MIFLVKTLLICWALQLLIDQVILSEAKIGNFWEEFLDFSLSEM